MFWKSMASNNLKALTAKAKAATQKAQQLPQTFF
jgi:hypothetical protein